MKENDLSLAIYILYKKRVMADDFTKSIDVFTESSDEFEPIEVEPRRVRDDFKIKKYKQYGSTDIFILGEDLAIKPWEKYCTVLDFVKTKYGGRKANVRLFKSSLIYDSSVLIADSGTTISSHLPSFFLLKSTLGPLFKSS